MGHQGQDVGVQPRRAAPRGHSVALVVSSLAALCGGALAQALAQPASPAVQPEIPTKVAYKPDRVVLLDIARTGNRLVAVGERGVVMTSDDGGKNWQSQRTKATRTLTGVAFADDRNGVAVGHGGTLLRTVDGGNTWTPIEVDAAGRDSLLGVIHLDGSMFVAYGAFGLYLESQDGGVSWTRRKVGSEDFDGISQVLKVGPDLLLVGESATLARSSDRGATWQKMDSPYQGSFFGGLVTGKGTVLIYGMRDDLSLHRRHEDLDQGRCEDVDVADGVARARRRHRRPGRQRRARGRKPGRRGWFILAKEAKGRSLSQVIGSGAGDLIVVGEAVVSTLDRSLWGPKCGESPLIYQRRQGHERPARRRPRLRAQGLRRRLDRQDFLFHISRRRPLLWPSSSSLSCWAHGDPAAVRGGSPR